MSLQSRLEALVAAIGADVKSLQSSAGVANAPVHAEWTATVTPAANGFQTAGAVTKDTANSNTTRVTATPAVTGSFDITNPNNYDEVWEIDGIHTFPAVQTGRSFFGFRNSVGADIMRTVSVSGEDRVSGSLTVRVPANSTYTFTIHQFVTQAAFTNASTTRIKFTLVTNRGQPGNAQEIASSVLNANYTPAGTSTYTISSWAPIVVPAGVAADIEVKGGCLFSVTTGTNASTVQQIVYLRLVDDLGAVVAFSQQAFYGTGVSQSLNFVLPFGASLDAQAADRTYHVEMRYNQQGVAGATSQLIAGSPFPRLVLQAVKR